MHSWPFADVQHPLDPSHASNRVSALLIPIHRCRYFSARPNESVSANDDDAPHVTIIRPVKGLEPGLRDCLASTFHQTYPRDKLTIYFCVSSKDDPAVPTLKALVSEHAPAFDVRLYVEEESPPEPADNELGPNPKIRNMSRAYREAKGDIMWIIDCNVWVGKGVTGRMVDLLEGKGANKKKNKFVHQLPLVVSIEFPSSPSGEREALLQPANGSLHNGSINANHGLAPVDNTSQKQKISGGGGRLEEMFLSSSHAKFYTAINTVLIAPCIVGKSNMFRRSHLNAITQGQGIDFFSHNICEDHLIGDLLWTQPVPDFLLSSEEKKMRHPWGNHAMLFGDLAIQPLAGMSVKEYFDRRVRWLRVRKFTVTLATLVEPGTESFLCSAYGAYAITHIPFFNTVLGIPQTWQSALVFWLLSTSIWCAFDRFQYRLLHSAQSVEVDSHTPAFARKPPRGDGYRRSFSEWLPAWLGREILAFPIWFWAVWGGVTVVWRGRKFWVGTDMRVHEYQDSRKSRRD